MSEWLYVPRVQQGHPELVLEGLQGAVGATFSLSRVTDSPIPSWNTSQEAQPRPWVLEQPKTPPPPASQAQQAQLCTGPAVPLEGLLPELLLPGGC